MPSVFDTLVDLTLGTASPVTPVTPPMFAPDAVGAALPELIVEVDAPAPPRRRRAEPATIPTPGRAARRDPDPEPGEPARHHHEPGHPPIVHAALARPLVTVVHRGAAAPAIADEPIASAAPRGDDDAGSVVRVHAGSVASPAPPEPVARTATSRDPGSTTARATTTRRMAERAGDPVGARAGPDAGADHASDRRESSGGDQVIRVTIGRVDVRAAAPRETARAAAPAASPRPGPALGDYLRDRGRRGGR